MFVEFTLRQFGERDETAGIGKNEKVSLRIRGFVCAGGYASAEVLFDIENR